MHFPVRRKIITYPVRWPSEHLKPHFPAPKLKSPAEPTEWIEEEEHKRDFQLPSASVRPSVRSPMDVGWTHQCSATEGADIEETKMKRRERERERGERRHCRPPSSPTAALSLSVCPPPSPHKKSAFFRPSFSSHYRKKGTCALMNA